MPEPSFHHCTLRSIARVCPEVLSGPQMPCPQPVFTLKKQIVPRYNMLVSVGSSHLNQSCDGQQKSNPIVVAVCLPLASASLFSVTPSDTLLLESSHTSKLV